MKQIQIITIIILSALLSSCLERNLKEENAHEHDEHHTENKEVEFSQEQLDLMQVKIDTPQERYISTSVKATGVLELPPQNKASLSAIAEGRVKNIKVTEGVAVKKGEILATIENVTFIELQKRYLSLKQKEKVLEEDMNRKRVLNKDSIISKKIVQEVIEKYKNNQIEIAALEAQMNLLDLNFGSIADGKIVSSIPIKSPINGYVRVININMNTYVHPGDVLFEIVDNEHLHIDLMVFEQDIPLIRNEQYVTFSMLRQPEKVYEATVFAVGKALEEEQRAMRVHAELKEEYYSLLPGMYVDATIHTNRYKQLAIPSESFVEDDEKSYVFVQKGNQQGFIFEKIAIKKGKEYNGFTVIELSKKIKKDSRVVIKGAFYLNAELNKETFEHSH